MRVQLNLFAKALVLVAFPLVCELGFTFSLFGMVQQLDQRAMSEHHLREALASLNSVYQRLTESSKLVATIFTKNGSASVMALHELTAPIPGDVSNLRQQLADDPAAIASLDKLDVDLAATLRILDEVFSQVENGDRIGALQHLHDLKHALPDLTEQLDDLRGRCTRDADYNFEQQRHERRHIELLVKYAIGFNVVLAIAVAVLINRNLTSRLAIVVENTRRLAENKPLMPPVGGSDEISHLDRVFKDMALALEMAHKKERAVIDTMPAGLMIVDAAGLVQMANPTSGKLLAYEEGQLLGQPVTVLFAGSSTIDPREFIEQLFLKAKERVDERNATRCDGTSFPVELSMTSFGVNDEQYYLLVLMDISERKEIERLKQEFVSMISHDLRTPLTSIQVFLNMLGKGMLGQMSESVQRKAEMADRNASRLINLINDLLDIEKMESGQLALSQEDSSLTSIVDRSIESVRGLADQQGISLELDCAHDVHVIADSDRLVQVLVNLLGNAVKFSSKGATVRVTVECDSSVACVKVIDQGRGIPEHLRLSVFERFKQVSTKDATERKGTGLGLAICKAIVEQHGGSIGVDSAEGHGSTFWFRLPALDIVPAAVG